MGTNATEGRMKMAMMVRAQRKGWYKARWEGQVMTEADLMDGQARILMKTCATMGHRHRQQLHFTSIP